MSQTKGKVPAHIKPKLFDHPEKSSRIISVLCEVEDPRQPSCKFSSFTSDDYIYLLDGRLMRGKRLGRDCISC